MMIALNKSTIEGVVDIECAMSLIDVKYLTLTLPKVSIVEMLASINVRDIENVLHQFSAYVMLDLYLDELFDDKKIRDHMRREFHVMNDLKCKLLMRLDIMISEEMIINLADKSLIILTCEKLIVSIRINLKPNSRIRRIVHSKEFVIVFSNSVTSILTYMRERKLSFNRNFLFESNHDALTASLGDMSGLYTHVCDCNLVFVHVRNGLFKSVIISLRTRLGLLIEYEEKECFQIESDLHE
jgi:hypothetical protein